ncbi:alpha/beta fold hydrolase [Antarctobacter jejuensis]|uniref:alpha/beta fold hydrolase n=1 Tax=Antarctobacter jejuensis TaxID=1439938 RepID=UPI003FCF0179
MTGWISHTSGGIDYLERSGPGTPLVLLHGIGSNAQSFTPLLPHLPQDLRVIAWHAPGYLGSAPLAQDWPQAADYALALEAFVDRLGLGPFALLGHSLGALMAASFAAARCNRVTRLVLAAPAIGHGVPAGGTLSAAAQSRIDDLEKMGAQAFAQARAPRLIHQPQDNPQALALVQEGMARVTLPGYAQAARMLASGRLLDDAERMAVPTDVICGAEDQVTPPDGARRVYAALRPQARGTLTLIPGAGHALYQQDPARFARALEDVAAPVV